MDIVKFRREVVGFVSTQEFTPLPFTLIETPLVTDIDIDLHSVCTWYLCYIFARYWVLDCPVLGETNSYYNRPTYLSVTVLSIMNAILSCQDVLPTIHYFVSCSPRKLSKFIGHSCIVFLPLFLCYKEEKNREKPTP